MHVKSTAGGAMEFCAGGENLHFYRPSGSGQQAARGRGNGESHANTLIGENPARAPISRCASSVQGSDRAASQSSPLACGGKVGCAHTTHQGSSSGGAWLRIRSVLARNFPGDLLHPISDGEARDFRARQRRAAANGNAPIVKVAMLRHGDSSSRCFLITLLFPFANDAAKADAAGGGIDLLGVSRGRSVSAAVVWRAQMRSALQHLPRNFDVGLAGIVARG